MPVALRGRFAVGLEALGEQRLHGIASGVPGGIEFLHDLSWPLDWRIRRAKDDSPERCAEEDIRMIDYSVSDGVSVLRLNSPPLVLIDMTGLDFLVATDRVMSRAFPRRGCLSQIVLRLVDRGHLGQKTGLGVYKYEKGDYTPHQSETAERIVAKVRQEAGHVPREVGKDEITQRLVLRMVRDGRKTTCGLYQFSRSENGTVPFRNREVIPQQPLNEAFCVMEEGIAGRRSDLDVAMVLGTGFSDFRGGMLKYARDPRLEQVLIRLEGLAQAFGPRFSPCRLLREMAEPS